MKRGQPPPHHPPPAKQPRRPSPHDAVAALLEADAHSTALDAVAAAGAAPEATPAPHQAVLRATVGLPRRHVVQAALAAGTPFPNLSFLLALEAAGVVTLHSAVQELLGVHPDHPPLRAPGSSVADLAADLSRRLQASWAASPGTAAAAVAALTAAAEDAALQGFVLGAVAGGVGYHWPRARDVFELWGKHCREAAAPVAVSIVRRLLLATQAVAVADVQAACAVLAEWAPPPAMVQALAAALRSVEGVAGVNWAGVRGVALVTRGTVLGALETVLSEAIAARATPAAVVALTAIQVTLFSDTEGRDDLLHCVAMRDDGADAAGVWAWVASTPAPPPDDLQTYDAWAQAKFSEAGFAAGERDAGVGRFLRFLVGVFEARIMADPPHVVSAHLSAMRAFRVSHRDQVIDFVQLAAGASRALRSSLASGEGGGEAAPPPSALTPDNPTVPVVMDSVAHWASAATVPAALKSASMWQAKHYRDSVLPCVLAPALLASSAPLTPMEAPDGRKLLERVGAGRLWQETAAGFAARQALARQLQDSGLIPSPFHDALSQLVGLEGAPAASMGTLPSQPPSAPSQEFPEDHLPFFTAVEALMSSLLALRRLAVDAEYRRRVAFAVSRLAVAWGPVNAAGGGSSVPTAAARLFNVVTHCLPDSVAVELVTEAPQGGDLPASVAWVPPVLGWVRKQAPLWAAVLDLVRAGVGRPFTDLTSPTQGSQASQPAFRQRFLSPAAAVFVVCDDEVTLGGIMREWAPGFTAAATKPHPLFGFAAEVVACGAVLGERPPGDHCAFLGRCAEGLLACAPEAPARLSTAWRRLLDALQHPLAAASLPLAGSQWLQAALGATPPCPGLLVPPTPSLFADHQVAVHALLTSSPDLHSALVACCKAWCTAAPCPLSPWFATVVTNLCRQSGGVGALPGTGVVTVLMVVVEQFPSPSPHDAHPLTALASLSLLPVGEAATLTAKQVCGFADGGDPWQWVLECLATAVGSLAAVSTSRSAAEWVFVCLLPGLRRLAPVWRPDTTDGDLVGAMLASCPTLACALVQASSLRAVPVAVPAVDLARQLCSALTLPLSACFTPGATTPGSAPLCELAERLASQEPPVLLTAAMAQAVASAAGGLAVGAHEWPRVAGLMLGGLRAVLPSKWSPGVTLHLFKALAALRRSLASGPSGAASLLYALAAACAAGQDALPSGVLTPAEAAEWQLAQSLQ